MSVGDGWRGYLPRARWYAAKAGGGTLTGIEPLPWLTAPGSLPAIRSELATLATGGGEQVYHLLVAYLPPGLAEPEALVGHTELPGLGGVDVVDAPASPVAMAAFLTALATTPPGMRWLTTPRAAAPEEIRVSTAEQSNSTVVAADRLVKVIRRLEAGLNPEPELLAVLAGTRVPRLHGVLSGAGYDLAVVSEFLPDAHDGWELATAACAAGSAIDDEAEQLGHALREVHACLAAEFGTATTSRSGLRDGFSARLAATAAEAPVVAAHAAALARAFDLPGRAEVTTQRVHGDFHLGQALWGRAGWRIIDFEGEPGVPIEQRRAFDSRWRDVAGLLRSLDYARSGHPEPSGQQARAWAQRARTAFLAGYGQAGADPHLLRAYEVDRMVYEVGYELRNRPEWVRIPLSAVEDEARRTEEIQWRMT